jgi:predicted outer membrane protein
MRKYSGWMIAPLVLAFAGVLSAQQVRDPATDREPAPGRAAAGQRDPARPGAAPRADNARPGADATRPGADATRPGGDATRPGAGAQTTKADQEIAAVKLAKNRNEIELAKLAQQKATSPEVKQFAEKMVEEHTAAAEKLEKWAGALASARGGADDRPAAPGRPGAAARPGEGADVDVRVAPGAPGAPGARPGADVTIRGGAPGGAAGSLNWVSVHQEIADQCLASAKKEFSQKEGEEFDKCFIGMAIGGHQHAVDADHVFMKHASPQFRTEIEEGLQMATNHLNQAKDIMQKLEGKSPRVTRRPE